MKQKQLVSRYEALEIARKSRDAYSYDGYGVIGWDACAILLARRGFNAEQIEEILRSKWTRWAGDGSNNRYGRYSGKDLARFLDSGNEPITPANYNRHMNW